MALLMALAMAILMALLIALMALQKALLRPLHHTYVCVYVSVKHSWPRVSSVDSTFVVPVRPKRPDRVLPLERLVEGGRQVFTPSPGFLEVPGHTCIHT